MSFFDLVFPKTCLGCGREGMYLCNLCMQKIKRPVPVCPYCRHPSIDGATHSNCQKRLGLDGLSAIWEYEGITRKAILALKYKYATEISKEISEHLISSLSDFVMPNVHFLTPIPVHWYRQNTRGFNQSLEIGRVVAVNMGYRFIPDLLIKKISTVPQAGLSGKARRKNMKGVFEINPTPQLPGMSCLLFDDVFTTGSTLFEATKVLKRSGVKKVWGLTIAR